MATTKPTRVCANSATRIELFSILSEARNGVDSATAAVALLIASRQLPADLTRIIRHLADTMNDLDDRIRRHLEDEGGRDAA